MHKLKKGIKEEKEWGGAGREGIEAEGLELTWSIEAKRKANNDKINNKEIVKKEIDPCVIAAVINWKKKIFIMKLLIEFTIIINYCLNILINHKLYIIISWVFGIF